MVACPTEAVWGLSCDPWNAAAVGRLLELKRRPAAKGLILVAGEEAQLEFLLAGLGPGDRVTMAAGWPGPSTWLVPHRGCVPAWVHGQHDTVAVRVTAHPGLSALCRAWGGALVSTSANRAGARPAREAYQVRRYFGDRLDYLLPGRVGPASRPTAIRDLANGRVVRL